MKHKSTVSFAGLRQKIAAAPEAKAAYNDGRNSNARDVPASEPSHNIAGALRTVLNILDAWEVSLEDRLMLLGCTRMTYDRWVNTRELGEASDDTVERLSYLLGIWKALQILFPDPRIANTWIHRPNTAPEFLGAPPLRILAHGQVEDLRRVRRFLDGWLS